MGEGLREKLNVDLQTGLQHGMANLAAELRGIIKQLLPQWKEITLPNKN